MYVLHYLDSKSYSMRKQKAKITVYIALLKYKGLDTTKNTGARLRTYIYILNNLEHGSLLIRGMIAISSGIEPLRQYEIHIIFNY
jgi:hypothetical protein